MWATGILAYELVVGRPPFEVNDEVQTATMIMFSNNINFPTKYSTLWVDFVRAALEKKPHLRPSAVQLLDHPWSVSAVVVPAACQRLRAITGQAACRPPLGSRFICLCHSQKVGCAVYSRPGRLVHALALQSGARPTLEPLGQGCLCLVPPQQTWGSSPA